MTIVLLVLVLALIWAAMTGAFSLLNMALGLLVAVLALLLLRDRVPMPSALRRVGKLVELLLMFLRELLFSAIRVGGAVLVPNPRKHLIPGIVAVPLTITSGAQITLLANMITLTPGTLSVDVAADLSVIYVHALVIKNREKFIADITGGFEAKIIEVFA